MLDGSVQRVLDSSAKGSIRGLQGSLKSSERDGGGRGAQGLFGFTVEAQKLETP